LDFWRNFIRVSRIFAEKTGGGGIKLVIRHPHFKIRYLESAVSGSIREHQGSGNSAPSIFQNNADSGNFDSAAAESVVKRAFASAQSSCPITSKRRKTMGK
jgi:hypothetical protein